MIIYRVGPDIRFGRISGRIPGIEIIRLDIQYCRIFSLTLLKLSSRISDNLVLYQTKLLLSGRVSSQTGYHNLKYPINIIHIIINMLTKSFSFSTSINYSHKYSDKGRVINVTYIYTSLLHF